jgi:predicted nucleotidyltransferase
LNYILNDLKSLKKYHVVVYGSILSEYYISHRSDIDIAIITLNREKKRNMLILKNLVGQLNDKYDIKIFELLPLYLQIEIINNYQVIFGDPLDISEYFYQYRLIWKDMVHRIEVNRFNSISEKLQLLERRNNHYQ